MLLTGVTTLTPEEAKQQADAYEQELRRQFITLGQLNDQAAFDTEFRVAKAEGKSDEEAKARAEAARERTISLRRTLLGGVSRETSQLKSQASGLSALRDQRAKELQGVQEKFAKGQATVLPG